MRGSAAFRSSHRLPVLTWYSSRGGRQRAIIRCVCWGVGDGSCVSVCLCLLLCVCLYDDGGVSSKAAQTRVLFFCFVHAHTRTHHTPHTPHTPPPNRCAQPLVGAVARKSEDDISLVCQMRKMGTNQDHIVICDARSMLAAGGNRVLGKGTEDPSVYPNIKVGCGGAGRENRDSARACVYVVGKSKGTHTHTHTYMHTYTLTYTHAHAHAHTYTHTYTLTCTHTHTHTYMHTSTHTHVHTHIHTHAHTYTHTHIHTHAHTYTCTCTHTHTYMHTHTHTHTFNAPPLLHATSSCTL